MANSNEAVNRLNHLAQVARFINGEISFQRDRLRIGDQIACVGDEVVTRRNDRTLHTDRGLMVRDRDHWIVQAVHPDGSATLTGKSGTAEIVADYLTSHVRLGYAQTSHATQGRTVDTALLFVGGPTDHAGVYTPMTRGRLTNHAYVVTQDNQAALDVLTQATSREWIDQPAWACAGRAIGSPPPQQLDVAEDLEYTPDFAKRAVSKRQARDRQSGWTLI
jgi:hypothetical protein